MSFSVVVLGLVVGDREVKESAFRIPFARDTSTSDVTLSRLTMGREMPYFLGSSGVTT